MSDSPSMPASPSRTTGFAALFASLGLHASLLGVVVAGALNLPSPPAAASWAGSTFEVSTLAEVPAPGAQLTGAGLDAGSRASEPERTAAAAALAAAPQPTRVQVSEVVAVPEAESSVADKVAEKAARPASSVLKERPGTARPKSPAEAPSADSRVTQPEKPDSTDAQQGSARGAPEATPADAASAGAAQSGSFGGEGAIKRKGSLPDAFTRVLPVAAQGAAWRSLALGAPGRFIVVVSLDEEGAVARVTPLGTSRPHALELARNLAMLLRSGRFAAPAEKGVNEYRLGVTPQIDETTPTPGGSLAFQPPVGKRPGHATLVQDSGRRIEFDVEVDPNWKD